MERGSFGAAFAFLSLAACTTTNYYVAPSDAGTDQASSSGDGGVLGPACEAYVACCTEIAGTQRDLASACDAAKKNIEDAHASGASTSAYETSCKAGLDSAHGMGVCQGDAGPVCPPPRDPPLKSTCITCSTALCKREHDACFASTSDAACDCRQLLDCLNGPDPNYRFCGANVACAKACTDTHASGSPLLESWSTCVDQNCSAACK
jgi:hypothetical protein